MIISKFFSGCLELNISKQPIVGFTEFNIILKNNKYKNYFFDNIKSLVRYVLLEFYNGGVNSYNLFLYFKDESMFCKIIPRFITSPYFIGYKLAQVHTYEKMKNIKNEYLKFRRNDEE
ncbi:DUF4931 domain-containing protein [Staphylococcus sp. EZ-P03]|uniref:DUF4931 domain-containing protein n=1 Tax=Staphylococcus sp. EZ-P03 TaxID=2282739 RepID=UPI0013C4E4CA